MPTARRTIKAGSLRGEDARNGSEASLPISALIRCTRPQGRPLGVARSRARRDAPGARNDSAQWGTRQSLAAARERALGLCRLVGPAFHGSFRTIALGANDPTYEFADCF